MFDQVFNNTKFLNRLFRKVDNVCWDLMSGGSLGIITDDGIATCTGEGDDAQINLNPFDAMSVNIPAFAQNTPVDAVKIGDIMYNFDGSKCGWVVEHKGKTFKVLKPSGERVTWTAPNTPMLGLGNGVMVLRSLTNMFGGDPVSTGAFNPMMFMAMMGGDEDSSIDFDRLIPLMLMSQMGQTVPGADGTAVPNPMAGMMGGANGMNPMMLMMMFSGKKKVF